MAVMFKDGAVLFVGGAVAFHEGCCCGYCGECCDQYVITITGAGGDGAAFNGEYTTILGTCWIAASYDYDDPTPDLVPGDYFISIEYTSEALCPYVLGSFYYDNGLGGLGQFEFNNHSSFYTEECDPPPCPENGSPYDLDQIGGADHENIVVGVECLDLP